MYDGITTGSAEDAETIELFDPEEEPTKEISADHESNDDLGGLSELSDSGDGSEPIDGDPED